MTTALRSHYSRNNELPEVTQLLRRYKKRAKMSQADLSRATYRSEAYVSRLFSSGERIHPIEKNSLLALAFAIGCSLPKADDLLLAGGWAPLESLYDVTSNSYRADRPLLSF